MILALYKTAAAALIFLISLATVIYPLRRKNTLSHAEKSGLGEALSSGIFLGAAFFHMLPDAIRSFAHANLTYTYPIPEAICIGGFLIMLFLERLSLVRSSVNSIPYILALILIIHALTEGAALGVGNTFSEAFMLFIAIAVHKGSESFALCIALLRHQLPLMRVILIILFFALMTPLGIILGTTLTLGEHSELIAAGFNAFAAGTFLYISTLHHIHFHKHTHDARGLMELMYLILGVVVMGLIAIWN